MSQDSFHLVPAADSGADVTFRCHTGDYILLVYGRLPWTGPWTPGGWRLRAIASRHASSLRCSRASKQALCEGCPDDHQYFHSGIDRGYRGSYMRRGGCAGDGCFQWLDMPSRSPRGHLRGAVAFPLEWTVVVQGTALQRLLASKGIMPYRTVVVYDVQRDRSAAMAHRLRTLGYARVLTYDAGVAAWAADARLPMAHLAHYEKLVPPVWVDQLVRGRSPATYPGHGFVVFEVGWENATAYQSGHIPGARYFALDAYEYAPLWTRVSDAALEARLLSESQV